MATATLTLTGTPNEGSTWTVTIENITGTNQVKDTTKYGLGVTVNVTSPSLGQIFTIDTTSGGNQVNGYSGSGVKYVTFRSTNPAGQHPTSGFSLDLWNDTLYDDIITSSSTWDDLNGNSYSLYTNKYSLIYSYGELYAPIFSKGGTLTITVA